MTPQDAPPLPVKASRRKSLILVACSGLLAAILLIVLANLDREELQARDQPPVTDLSDIVPPLGIPTDDLRADETLAPVVTLPEGGSLQITDRDTGALAQQYFFARLDPNPEGYGPGWMHMTEPRLEVYLSGDRVAVLTGDSALAYRPNEAFESGTVTGHVEIELYEDIPDKNIDPAVHEPSLIVRTREAKFENVIGEVLCEDDVQLETRAGEFRGHHLRMLIDDLSGHVRVEVREQIHIRLAADQAPASAGATDDAAPPPPAGASDRNTAPPATVAAAETDAAPTNTVPTSATKPPSKQAPAAQASPGGDPSSEDAPFYLMTMHEDVQIVQGTGADARTAHGDRLQLIFTMKSETGGTSLAGPTSIESAPGRPIHRSTFLLSAALAAPGDDEPVTRRLAPPPSADDTNITCGGSLTIEPLDDEARRLDSRRDALLQLFGAPVTLTDPGADSNATCDELRYHTRAGRLELVGSPEEALVMANPEFRAEGELFWFQEENGTGGFTGPGTIRFSEPYEPGAGAGPPDRDEAADRLSIVWTNAVDLRFSEGADGGGPGTIERARFTGDVRASSRDVGLSDGPSEGPSEGETSGAEGTIEAQDIELILDTIDGQQIPRRVIARDSVRIADAEQTMWAELVDVTLGPETDDDTSGRSRIERMIAEDDVQLLGVGGERVLADRVELDGDDRTAILTGQDVRIIDDRHLIDRTRRIEIDDETGQYTVVGGGRFRRFNGAVGHDGPDRLPEVSLDVLPGRDEELRVTWHDGVDIAAVETGAEPTEAVFRGNVEVLTPELKLAHADALQVRFASSEGGSEQVESITATGDVNARALERDAETGRAPTLGSLACQSLHVDMTPSAEGETIPERMHATGAVHVSDPDQQLWTSDLKVTFRSTAGGSQDGAADDSKSRVDIDVVEASGGVHMLLPDGEHVFGDSFVARTLPDANADGPNGVADLHGQRVVVLSQNFVLDEVTHLRVDTTARRYEVVGPGVFNSFADPLPMPAATGLLAPPALDLDRPRTLEAAWSTSAVFTEVDDGAGTLELTGEVHAESHPNALELNVVDAGTLILEFEKAGATDEDATGRRLAALVARRTARVENRTWVREDHADTPRVFSVAGDDIRFDQRTMEADVIGAGELLIRDVETDFAPSTGGQHRGTTLFRWSERLRLEPVVDARYTILMDGDVEYLHRDLEGATSTLTGQHLEADVERRGDAPESGNGALDLGGSMEPKRLAGRGGLRIRTSTGRDVTCDAFEYNTLTGMAVISADRGRLVSVLTENSTRPYRAESLLWNMRDDTITINRAAAAGAP